MINVNLARNLDAIGMIAALKTLFIMATNAGFLQRGRRGPVLLLGTLQYNAALIKAWIGSGCTLLLKRIQLTVAKRQPCNEPSDAIRFVICSHVTHRKGRWSTQYVARRQTLCRDSITLPCQYRTALWDSEDCLTKLHKHRYVR